MAEPFLGEIKMVGFGYAPRGFKPCNGQILAINTNQALFALLGTTFGGDGRVNFALPNLQGRAPVHMGQGPGLQVHTLGELGGAASHTLTQPEAAHSHSLKASANQASNAAAAGKVLAAKRRGGRDIYHSSPDVSLDPS